MQEQKESVLEIGARYCDVGNMIGVCGTLESCGGELAVLSDIAAYRCDFRGVPLTSSIPWVVKAINLRRLYQ